MDDTPLFYEDYMTISEFKDMVAAYLNRTAASLVTANSLDLLLRAMNDARVAAQRDHMFELNRTENAYLVTSVAGANWQTGCTLTPGGTAMVMRRIDEVWNYSTSLTTGGTTYYPRTTRIDFSYSGQMKRELPTVDNRNYYANPQDYSVQARFAYCIGNKLFVTTMVSETSVKLVGIQWLPDLVDADPPDIFLTYFVDWFKWATLTALNVYLKDSERFPVDTTVLQRSWDSVKNYDGSVANMGESVNLD